MSVPTVSVVMPVRNGLRWLDDSVGSVLDQTYTDFEFVILDDASTDGSAARVESWARRDSRIRLVRSREPLGPVGSSNAAVAASRGRLIARMDADDVSHPARLARQVTLCGAGGDVALVGALMEGIDQDGRLVRPVDRWRLVRRSTFAPFPHGSILVPRVMLDHVGGYRKGCEYWEDLDLYLRLSRVGRLLVIPDALYRYRFHADSARCERQDAVLRATALMLRCVDRFRRGDPYDDLIERSGAPSGDGGASSVLAAYASNAHRLWSATRIDVWRHIGARDLVTADPRVFAVCAVATAAAISPRGCRAALARFIRVRDRLVARRVGGGPIEWRFASS